MIINQPTTRIITLAVTISLILATVALPEDAYARKVRGNTRVNVNRGANINKNRNVNRNTNINKNVNRNVNINRDRDVHIHGGYHGGYRHGYYHDHNDGIGVGGAIAIGVAGLAIGSIVTAASMPPPSSCSMTTVNGITYQRCGSTWYQPQYSGSNVTYVVVNPPRY